jgi:hypothetical protein
VATKEGGAITGEERIREHLDVLYGAFLGWEGKPAKYQIERLDALKHELGDVAQDLEHIVAQEIRPLDAELANKKLTPIPTTPPAPAAGEPRADALHPVRDPAVANAVRCGLSHGVSCEEIRAAPARDERD